MNWQPIETAPKTGKFLAFWRSKYFKNPVDILEWNETGTHLWAGSVAIHELEVSFSHWMPLPDPPTGAK